MDRRHFLALAGATPLAAAFSATAQTILSPDEAVALAGKAYPRPVKDVVVRLDVRGTGDFKGNIFLNSMEEWRDPRNLAVVIGPVPARQLHDLLGGDPEKLLVGRSVVVSGEVIRRYIQAPQRWEDLGPNRPYYPVHLPVDVLRQLQVI